MNKDELKAIYFSFYDQLLPEHAEKAKANYDAQSTKNWVEERGEPQSHEEAVYDGFLWVDTAEICGYWGDVHESLVEGTYPLQLTPQECTRKAKEYMYGSDPIFPEDDTERQKYPFAQTDLFFPDADAAFSNMCLVNQQKHCPEVEGVTWASEKSIGDGSQLRRHLLEFLKAVQDGDMETADKEIKSIDWRGRELHQRWIKKMPPFNHL